MYLKHFNLEKKPFQLSPDTAFLWLGKKQAASLALLKAGMTTQGGLFVLTGDIGTGKTILVNELTQTLDKKTSLVKIVDPYFEMHAIFSIISQALGFESCFKNTGDFNPCFTECLKSAVRNNTKIVVVVDEAQRMSSRFLHEVLAWSRSGFDHVLSILLAGQLELEEVLKTAAGDAWEEMVRFHAIVDPLSEIETAMYMNTRLEKAGADHTLFLPSAIREAHTYSKGIPRVLNIACDLALAKAFIKEMDTIDAALFKEVVHQLALPVPAEKKDALVEKKQDLPAPASPFIQKKLMAGFSAAGILFIFGTLYFGSGPPPELNKTTVLKPILEKTAAETTTIGTALPQIQKETAPVKADLGLGYTPAPEPAEKKLPEPMIIEEALTPEPSQETAREIPLENLQEIQAHQETVEPEKAKDPVKMDDFLNDVFLVQKPPTFDPAPAFDSSPALEDANSDKKIDTESTISPSAQSIPKPVREQVKKPEKNENPDLLPELFAEQETQAPSQQNEPEPDAIIDWLIKNKKIRHEN